MRKRLIDIVFSFTALLLLSPLILLVSLVIYLEDFESPFYFSYRIGINNTPFKMIKFRTMEVNSDSTGVDSTSLNDNRITKTGKVIRKFKIDEILQLWNVLVGNMSLVGPRPNVKRETDIYTMEEKRLLRVKPGITDFASIVFSDEAYILDGKSDPDIAYNQLIRPGKSRLGLLYVSNYSIFLDFAIIALTLMSFISRKLALRFVSKLVRTLGVDKELINLCLRTSPLIPTPPPGMKKIVTRRTS